MTVATAIEERSETPDLRLSDVGVEFAGSWLFRHVDFVVPPGRWIAVVGPSGSGKTTLVRLLAGLADPSEGRALVGARSWRALRGPERVTCRRSIGYVQQQPGLFHTTVLENVAISLRWRGISRETAERMAREALDAAAVNSLAGKNALSLSGGERQRVAFARAVASKPRILLLDEFTNHQDAERADLLEGLVGQHLTRGGSVVVVAHDLPQLDRIRAASGTDPAVGVLVQTTWSLAAWDELPGLFAREDLAGAFLRRLSATGTLAGNDEPNHT